MRKFASYLGGLLALAAAFAPLTASATYLVPQGGTGAISFAAGSLVLGNGSNALTAFTGTAYGQLIMWNGSSWTHVATSSLGIASGGVSSVFGRTGVVTAQSGDYTTAQVTESGNLYFTNARAQNAISLTTSGSSGAATYSGGVLNVPQYSGGASSTLLADNNTFSGANTFTQNITGSVTGNAGTATKLQNSRTINTVAFDGTANIVITAASSTLLANNNTWSGINAFGTISAGTWNGSVIGSSFGGAGSVSGILKANGSGTVSAATNGTDFTLITANTCTNQVLTSVTAAGVFTCNTVANAALAHSTIVVNGTTLTLGDSADTLSAASSTLLANNNTFSGNNQFTASTTFTKVINAANASSSLNTFGTVWSGITSALWLADGNGKVTAATTQTCTNQFLRSMSAAYSGTCASVNIASDVSGLATGVATFLGTPSSANLAAAITDETGSGALVFAASPTFTGTVNTANVVIGSGSSLTNTGVSNGCATWASGALGSTGTACGSGGGGSQTPWTSQIDGGGFALVDAGNVTGTAFIATSTTVASSFQQASSTQFSAYTAAYFGATATSSFNSTGQLSVGTSTHEKDLVVEGTTGGGIARFIRDVTSVLANSVYGTQDVDLNEGTAFADQTGPAQTFSGRVNGGATIDIWGDISAIRNGADTTGSVQLRSYLLGNPIVGIIDSGYNNGIGNYNTADTFDVFKAYGSATTNLFTVSSSTAANGSTASSLFNISSTGAITTSLTSGAVSSNGSGVLTSGTLSIANGGTNQTSFTGTNALINFDGTHLSAPSTGYTLSSTLLTAPNASTTNLTVGTSLQIPSGANPEPTVKAYCSQSTNSPYQIQCGNNAGATSVYDDRTGVSFYISSTTAMTASTTEIVSVPTGFTATSLQCTVQPAGATAEIEWYYANPTAYTSVTAHYAAASSTPGQTAMSSNNAPATNATSTLIAGNFTGSPTSVACNVFGAVTGI